MKRGAIVAASLLSLGLFAGAAHARHRGYPPLKIVLSPASTVPSAGIVKNLEMKCPNVTLTLNSKESDYMLEARGWPQHYRFTLFRKGGTAVFATSTIMLSNAVKDVCKYVNSNSPPK